jgi:hypothetical protein
MDSDFASIDPAELLAVQAEIQQRVDPDGSSLQLEHQARAFLEGRLQGVSRLFGHNTQQLAEVLADVEHSRRDTAAVLLLFTPRGWATSSMAQMPAYRTAIEILEGGGSAEEAEQAIEDGWNQRQVVNFRHQLAAFLPYDDETRSAQIERSRLIDKAWAHHEAGAYEASIPIVLAQAEGLTYDAVGRAFFSKGTADDDIVDDLTLAGMQRSLPAARTWFSGDVRQLQSTGGCSRHGVLHGREVGYATKRNSVKAFALLAAVWDMAQPRLRAQADDRAAERDARWAGSDEVDESGRRRDRRGFDEARETLRQLYFQQLVAGTIDGRYPEQPAPVRRSGDGAWRPEAFTWQTSADASAWWAWTRAESGWVFAIAGRGIEEWFWDGAEPPADGPWNLDEWTSDDDPVRPNWRGTPDTLFDIDE